MIGLTIALLLAGQAGAGAPSTGASSQAVPAQLDSCALEGGRWVCRYTVPSVEIIPFVGSPEEADPNPEGEATSPTLVQPGVAGAQSPAVTGGTQMAALPNVTPRAIEPSILSETETRLMNRCADAGVFSLCLPDDRRQARALRDRQTQYDATLRVVTGLIAEDRCDAAIRAALDGGYLSLAGQARSFCTAPGPETIDVEVTTPEE